LQGGASTRGELLCVAGDSEGVHATVLDAEAGVAVERGGHVKDGLGIHGEEVQAEVAAADVLVRAEVAVARVDFDGEDVNTVKKLVDECVSGEYSGNLRPHDAVSALGPMYDVHDKNHLPRLEVCDRGGLAWNVSTKLVLCLGTIAAIQPCLPCSFTSLAQRLSYRIVRCS
jgi:hypothetical protein